MPIIVLLLIANSLMAASINNSSLTNNTTLIESGNTSNLEYQNLINSNNFSDFIENYQKSRRFRSSRSSLNRQFDSATAEFNSGQISTAGKIFLKIANQRFEADWSINDRIKVHFVLLRLAQINPYERAAWLKKAKHFDRDLKIDPDIFPPSLINEYNSIKLPQPISLKAKGYILYFNGKPISPASALPLFGRWSYLSNRYKPIHKIGLPNEPIARIPLVTGPCSQLEFQIPKGMENENFKSSHCKFERRKKSLGLQISKENSAKVKSTWKKNWLWIGAGILTAVYLSQKNNNNSKSPTTTNSASHSDNL